MPQRMSWRNTVQSNAIVACRLHVYLFLSFSLCAYLFLSFSLSLSLSISLCVCMPLPLFLSLYLSLCILLDGEQQLDSGGNNCEAPVLDVEAAVDDIPQ